MRKHKQVDPARSNLRKGWFLFLTEHNSEIFMP